MRSLFALLFCVTTLQPIAQVLRPVPKDSSALSQERPASEGDEEKLVLSLDDFQHWVITNHPVLKANQALVPQARARVLESRGAFDPKLLGNYAEKRFKEDLYYQFPHWSIESQLRGPVELGLDWNQTAGLYTNPQDKLPEEGLYALGAMVQLGNGLWTDARRTDLALAKQGVSLSEAEARLYNNKLLAKSAKAYWTWYAAHYKLEAYERAWSAAQQVRAMTLQRYQAGDASAFDTLDANALVSTYEVAFFQAKNEAVSALYDASTYLWDEQMQPVLIGAKVVPSPEAPQWEGNALPQWNEHPLVQYNNAKERQLSLKAQLAAEYTRPKLSVGGALLFPGGPTNLSNMGSVSTDNAVLKAKFEMPLFLREGRGYLKAQRIELQRFEWNRAQQENTWQREAEAVLSGASALMDALAAARRNADAMEQLLTAEQTKLALGDSELIKVNLRTSYYLKAVVDLLQLEKELGAAHARYLELVGGFTVE